MTTLRRTTYALKQPSFRTILRILKRADKAGYSVTIQTNTHHTLVEVK